MTNRRDFFRNTTAGLGGMAMASLLNPELFATQKAPHFKAKAKHVIFLAMGGAPSQLDLFDYKPELKKHHGEKVPQSLIEGERFAFLSGVPTLLGSPFEFKQYGKSGTHMTALLPNVDRKSVV